MEEIAISKKTPLLPLASMNENLAVALVKKQLAGIPGVKRVLLFGSRVRGDFHSDSDMDILIVVKDLENKNLIIHTLHDIEIAKDVPLAPVILTYSEYKKNKEMGSGFIRSIEKEGIKLYDSDS